jgi:hypothetical protein
MTRVSDRTSHFATHFDEIVGMKAGMNPAGSTCLFSASRHPNSADCWDTEGTRSRKADFGDTRLVA